MMMIKQLTQTNCVVKTHKAQSNNNATIQLHNTPYTMS